MNFFTLIEVEGRCTGRYPYGFHATCEKNYNSDACVQWLVLLKSSIPVLVLHVESELPERNFDQESEICFLISRDLEKLNIKFGL